MLPFSTITVNSFFVFGANNLIAKYQIKVHKAKLSFELETLIIKQNQRTNLYFISCHSLLICSIKEKPDVE